MTYDDDDLFDEEFDFVDEEDDVSEDDVSEDDDNSAEDPPEDDEVEEKKPTAKKKARPTKAKNGGKRKPKATDSDVVADESSAEASGEEKTEEKTESEPEEAPEPPGPPTDHVVHLYEFGDFTRTIPREFTSEDAEAFAIEYNRTSSPHSRQAVAAGKDEEHALSVSQTRKAARG